MMDSETNHKTVLDVEDDTQRQDRIQGLLEKLNSDTKSQVPPPGPPRFEFRDRSTFAVNPPTELISRVQDFLPQIQAANEALVERVRDDPDGVCIEYIEHASEYIEMNLGLGVFESRNKGTQEHEDAEMSYTSSSSEEAGQDDSDFDSDASSEIITSFVPARPVRPLPRRSRASPQITVLEDKPEE